MSGAVDDGAIVREGARVARAVIPLKRRSPTIAAWDRLVVGAVDDSGFTIQVFGGMGLRDADGPIGIGGGRQRRLFAPLPSPRQWRRTTRKNAVARSPARYRRRRKSLPDTLTLAWILQISSESWPRRHRSRYS